MSRFLSRLASLVWWSLLVVLVLLALYAAIGRQLTSNVNAYKDDLANTLAEQTGLDIQIGQLGSRWHWLDPTLVASDIAVRSPDNDTFSANLAHLRVRLDFWSSLRRLRIVFKELEADDLALTLIRPGELPVSEAVEEVAPFLDPENTPDWLMLAGRWLSDPQARVTRVNVSLGSRPDDLRDFYIPQLDLIYRRGLFQASGRAMRSGTSQQLASFALVGQHFLRGDFTGQLYMDVASGRLFDGLMDDMSWRGIRVEGFDLGGQAWLTFEGGQLTEVQGSVSTPYVQLGAEQQSLAPLEDIQARFGWRSGEALVLQQLRWRWQDSAVEPFNVRLQHRKDGLVLAADELPLDPVRGFIQALPLLPGKSAEALANFQPSGYLDDVFLVLPDSMSEFRLFARLRDAGVKAWKGAPGASGIRGYLQMNANGGFVQLADGEPGTVHFPKVFAGAWSFQSMAGRVSWQREGPVTRVYSDNLRFVHRDNARLTGAFDLRLEREGEDNLGLRATVENADATLVSEFVPAKVVDESFYQWLTDSVREGRITAGRYYGHGRVGDDLPKGAFTSSMWYEFDRSRVRYDPDWPEVTEAAGRVQIHNEGALITLNEGRSGGLEIGGSTIRVQPGNGSSPARLQVEASPRATGEDVSWWLANTPLGDEAGELIRNADYGGRFQLDLGVDIPLAETVSPVVSARMRTKNGQFGLPQHGLSWRGITGDLTFNTERGFSGQPLRADFFGQPVAVHLSSPDNQQALTVRQTGQLPIPDFLWRMGMSENSGLGLSGTLGYTAELNVDSDIDPTITVSSDLSGLNVDWPEPLGKSANETAPLTATLDPFAESGLKVTGRWQDRLSFNLQMKDSGFDLVFRELSLGTHELDQISINALDLGDRWIVHTDSERASGRFVLPSDDGVIQADLQTLRLVRQGDQSRPSDTELFTLEEQLEAFRELEIGNWPDIDVSIRTLWLGDDQAGSWRFRLRPQSGRLNVEQIEGRLGSLTLAGDLQWLVVNSEETSRFQGRLSGGALRDLEALTGSAIPLNNQETKIELDLNWPGSPHDIAASQLNGSIRGRLDDGVILEESSSAQLFRVFNLLNTDTLWRRLKLDFSDLYEAGVAFDAISAKADIADGRVTLAPELQLAGPSGAFKLTGTTDMADESLDMKLVVVLPVTQNLPLAAVLFGAGAPIGGALFVLDKLLGDPLSRLTSATYSVTGGWSDPKVDLRGVFDTE